MAALSREKSKVSKMSRNFPYTQTEHSCLCKPKVMTETTSHCWWED